MGEILQTAHLTFAAEELGACADRLTLTDAQILALYRYLLAHDEPVVREGALLGLATWAGPGAFDLAVEISMTDASSTIRECAEDAAQSISDGVEDPAP